jgi:hypothetical protein
MTLLTYLKHFIALLIAAYVAKVCFDAGLFLLDDSPDEKYLRQTSIQEKLTELVENPTGLEIPKVNAQISYRNLVLTGIVSNVGQQDWVDPRIGVTVFAGSIEIGRCSRSQGFLIKPGESKDFVVVCENIKGSGIPDFMKFETKVTEAWDEMKSL